MFDRMKKQTFLNLSELITYFLINGFLYKLLYFLKSRDQYFIFVMFFNIFNKTFTIILKLLNYESSAQIQLL